MKEENVYEDTTGAEETDAVSTSGGDRKDAEKHASTVPGKFKSVDALARAYESLQAEFTRRSQRLKELERQAENRTAEADGAARSGAGKLRKNAQARRAENKRFDEFVAEAMKVGVRKTPENAEREDPALFGEDPSGKTLQKSEIQGNGATVYAMNENAAGTELAREEVKADPNEETPYEVKPEEGYGKDLFKAETEKALVRENALTSVAESGSATDPVEDLYTQVSRDEKVRLKIIGEYLSSIGKTGAPLMTGGVGLLATPPKKAKSISDAGNMALQYFKKPASEA